MWDLWSSRKRLLQGGLPHIAHQLYRLCQQELQIGSLSLTAELPGSLYFVRIELRYGEQRIVSHELRQFQTESSTRTKFRADGTRKEVIEVELKECFGKTEALRIDSIAEAL